MNADWFSEVFGFISFDSVCINMLGVWNIKEIVD